ncbi:tripartite tricarboxylate transporter substrate binding protein [Bosea sp. (in: a-proteobacteria)]|uniref:tripartite tricarboxylate transporter substrate binding protein n=1 Tax=Bosea sp. (in: a-proteobacteria) TaxID=1871050 RepID=UPI001AC18235|nr:tripartite tricarboxylate transporter substrate binding protein [Bosea sp. (in: a-proteobacteria)]MBN9439638.1 tripartite tricarboxylate transporter substrate binding protein [Bosea sp. (in: a-proteobacteria)]
MLKRMTLAAVALAASVLAVQAKYPERPITLIVPWAAGGGTDAVARLIAGGLEQELGTPVNVVNRVGAGGVIAHAEIAKAAPDGYTIGLATTELSTYYWGATGDITWKNFTPIALVNFDPSAIHVNATSQWKAAKEVVEAIRAGQPSTYKMSGVPIGGAAHLAFGGLLHSIGIDPNKVTLVPTQGAAPGFQQLAAGGVHIVASSLPEGASMVEAGKVRALATIGNERTAAFPNVPTANEALGANYSAGAWRGIVAPPKLPADVRERLTSSLKKVYESENFTKTMKGRGFGLVWAAGDDFAAYLDKDFTQTGDVMKAIGIRQRD